MLHDWVMETGDEWGISVVGEVGVIVVALIV